MRISRPCYDKSHRCPGWAGGGWRSRRTITCAGGSLREGRYYEGRLWAWRFNRHACRTIVLPYVVRYVDPTWWSFALDRRRDARRDQREVDTERRRWEES